MKWTKVAALFVVALLAATSGFAQTNGRIQGAVKDSNGASVPGVSLVATAPELPGNITAVSGNDGTFRLLNLPPGNYTVSASLDGFNTVEQRDIRVGIDRTVTLELTMTAAFAGELTVLGDAPVVDTSNATAGVSVSAETFERIPMTRDFYAVAQVATGASADASGTTVYGSTGAENAYVIEGLNTTGIEVGGEAKTLNFDFLQEVEIKTGGLPAEYGRLTGGLINAITKSGGNDFSGDVFGFYEGGSLQSDDSTARRPLARRHADRRHRQPGRARLRPRRLHGQGQALVLRRLQPGRPHRRDHGDQRDLDAELAHPRHRSSTPTSRRDLYAGKLTYRINSSNNLAFSIFGDPTTRAGNVFDDLGPGLDLGRHPRDRQRRLRAALRRRLRRLLGGRGPRRPAPGRGDQHRRRQEHPATTSTPARAAPTRSPAASASTRTRSSSARSSRSTSPSSSATSSSSSAPTTSTPARSTPTGTAAPASASTSSTTARRAAARRSTVTATTSTIRTPTSTSPTRRPGRSRRRSSPSPTRSRTPPTPRPPGR